MPRATIWHRVPVCRWSRSLPQAFQARERVRIRRENQTLAIIAFQNSFRRYRKLAGIAGPAETGAAGFRIAFRKVVHRTGRQKFPASPAAVPASCPAATPGT